MVRGSFALVAALWGASAAAGEMAWVRRTLRAASPRGYVAVVALRANGEGRAAIHCEREGIALTAGAGQWKVESGGSPGRLLASGALDGPSPTRFFAKRTAETLMLGVDGRWVYGCRMAARQGKASVRIGTTAEREVETFRLVAREPVSFADDFPDPEPKTGVWVPVRGRWVLSSLSFPEQSANPAELAAAFEELEDEASRGRTRSRFVGIGARLTGGSSVRILRLAGNSPAARAGLKQDDYIRSINGVAVRSSTHATSLLQGKEGDTVALVVVQRGVERKVTLTLEQVVWGRTRRYEPIPPVGAGDDQALIVAGYDFWTDYRIVSAVQTRSIGGFGLAFAVLGPRDYHLFRWLSAEALPEGPGRWQIVRVRGGHETIVAERDGGFYPNDYYRVRVDIEGDLPGKVRAVGRIDGTQVIEAADDAIVPGRIGLWATAPGVVCFDDVVVGDPARKPVRGSAARSHRTDHIMRAWADPGTSWQYAGLGQRWWHKCAFPGDVAIIGPIIPDKGFELVVAAARDDELSGYVFELLEDQKLARLRRGETIVARKPLAGGWPRLASLERKGGHIQAQLDGKPWLTFTDPAPLRGTAVRVRGFLVRDIVVGSPNVVEYFFNAAPTEWHVMHGHWEVMNRWVCDPRWSFFGGRSDAALAVWSKRRLDGDCSIDVHLGVMMFERSGSYENMRDVCLTLCGDGRDLHSGYTVIVGAEGNTKTALFRKGKCVQTTRERHALLAGRNSKRGSELYSQHRGWMHLQLRRVGDRVRFYLWGQLVFDYQDPEPLPGGHAAIWSLENGLLIGKARLAADRISAPIVPVRQYRAFGDGALTSDCGGGHVKIERQGSTYQITNVAGGGRFAAAFRPRVFSAFGRPVLEFEIKRTAEARVDCFFRSHGKLYRVVIGGPPKGWTPAEAVDHMDAPADGQWHKVRIDFLAALRARYPDDPLLMVWEPVLANHCNEGYLLAGFSGNGAGATYWLRNLRLRTVGQGPVLSRKPAGL